MVILNETFFDRMIEEILLYTPVKLGSDISQWQHCKSCIFSSSY